MACGVAARQWPQSGEGLRPSLPVHLIDQPPACSLPTVLYCYALLLHKGTSFFSPYVHTAVTVLVVLLALRYLRALCSPPFLFLCPFVRPRYLVCALCVCRQPLSNPAYYACC